MYKLNSLKEKTYCSFFLSQGHGIKDFIGQAFLYIARLFAKEFSQDTADFVIRLSIFPKWIIAVLFFVIQESVCYTRFFNFCMKISESCSAGTTNEELEKKNKIMPSDHSSSNNSHSMKYQGHGSRHSSRKNKGQSASSSQQKSSSPSVDKNSPQYAALHSHIKDQKAVPKNKFGKSKKYQSRGSQSSQKNGDQTAKSSSDQQNTPAFVSKRNKQFVPVHSPIKEEKVTTKNNPPFGKSKKFHARASRLQSQKNEEQPASDKQSHSSFMERKNQRFAAFKEQKALLKNNQGGKSKAKKQNAAKSYGRRDDGSANPCSSVTGVQSHLKYQKSSSTKFVLQRSELPTKQEFSSPRISNKKKDLKQNLTVIPTVNLFTKDQKAIPKQNSYHKSKKYHGRSSRLYSKKNEEQTARRCLDRQAPPCYFTKKYRAFRSRRFRSRELEDGSVSSSSSEHNHKLTHFPDTLEEWFEHYSVAHRDELPEILSSILADSPPLVSTFEYNFGMSTSHTADGRSQPQPQYHFGQAASSRAFQSRPLSQYYFDQPFTYSTFPRGSQAQTIPQYTFGQSTPSRPFQQTTSSPQTAPQYYFETPLLYSSLLRGSQAQSVPQYNSTNTPRQACQTRSVPQCSFGLSTPSTVYQLSQPMRQYTFGQPTANRSFNQASQSRPVPQVYNLTQPTANRQATQSQPVPQYYFDQTLPYTTLHRNSQTQPQIVIGPLASQQEINDYYLAYPSAYYQSQLLSEEPESYDMNPEDDEEDVDFPNLTETESIP
ncbi:uncharacterized protein LOC106663342 isoform X3 [Cimex lectularius]|uniref:Uncharacterized protein n=1 Tax=Cimex lectularius TaxID=79782 RepID=A0A8I6TCE0_CIMLE|nr:uncharacterized protein LOC106663342 isoform X3 [Cimex lectularius]